MSAFEYLSVLISIILALGMTRVLGGVGEMLQARSRRHIYWVHIVWIVNLFLYLVVAWWIFYRWRNQQPLYLASLLLFPREGDIDLAVDYKRITTRTTAPFFILFALFTPIDIFDSLLKGVPHFLGLGPQYFVSSFLYVSGLTTAAITQNERYHQFYAIFFLVQTIFISFTIFHTLV